MQLGHQCRPPPTPRQAGGPGPQASSTLGRHAQRGLATLTPPLPDCRGTEKTMGCF